MSNPVNNAYGINNTSWGNYANNQGKTMPREVLYIAAAIETLSNNKLEGKTLEGFDIKDIKMVLDPISGKKTYELTLLFHNNPLEDYTSTFKGSNHVFNQLKEITDDLEKQYSNVIITPSLSGNKVTISLKF